MCTSVCLELVVYFEPISEVLPTFPLHSMAESLDRARMCISGASQYNNIFSWLHYRSLMQHSDRQCSVFPWLVVNELI